MTTEAAELHGDRAGKTMELALRLAQAENALQAFTFGQIDAVIDPGGRTHLLHGAQEHLRRSETDLHALVDSTSDLIFVINRGGRIISQNRAVYRFLGTGAVSHAGGSFFEFIFPEDISKVHAAFIKVIDGFRDAVTLEFRHRTSEEVLCLFEATVTWLRDPAVSRVVLVCRDITQRMHAKDEATRREAEFVKSAHTKDLFLAMIAHELRAPLMPSLLCVDALLRDERLAEIAPALAVIRRNIGLQARLLTELTDFVAVGQHKVRPCFELIDAHASVRAVVEICQSEIAAAGLSVSLDLHGIEFTVIADTLKFQQILWNLLKNAIKFSPHGGCVTIASANAASGFLTLEFIDHGIGIEPALLPLVFDAFQQGEAWIQQLSGGLGLGLYIAKHLTEAQHGTLTAFSKGRGEGATFRLTLKTAAATSPRESDPN